MTRMRIQMWKRAGKQQRNEHENEYEDEDTTNMKASTHTKTKTITKQIRILRRKRIWKWTRDGESEARGAPRNHYSIRADAIWFDVSRVAGRSISLFKFQNCLKPALQKWRKCFLHALKFFKQPLRKVKRNTKTKMSTKRIQIRMWKPYTKTTTKRVRKWIRKWIRTRKRNEHENIYDWRKCTAGA